MNAAERRTKITHLLAQANGPLSATALAAQCGVSRQIIVGDVALLRAGGLAVLATPRGYILENTSAPTCAERHIVSHHDNSRMLEELYTVVDLGGAVIDVTVEHAVYGQICAPLHIFSRYDADAFNEKIQQSGSRPLSNLTGGIHLHTIRATDEKTLERVIQPRGSAHEIEFAVQIRKKPEHVSGFLHFWRKKVSTIGRNFRTTLERPVVRSCLSAKL